MISLFSPRYAVFFLSLVFVLATPLNEALKRDVVVVTGSSTSSSSSSGTSSTSSSSYTTLSSSVSPSSLRSSTSRTSTKPVKLKISTASSSNLTTSTTSNSLSRTLVDTSTITTPLRSPCSIPATVSDSLYCRIHVSTVQLHFWPTGSVTDNLTYPSTTVLSEYDLTMTSPLIYYIIATMSALDWCSQMIGPMFTNVITSFPLSEVSTLEPYANTIVTTRMGPPRQLQLSDLRSDCPIVTSIPPSNHNVLDPDDPGCNPVLEWKTELLQVGGADWAGCGRYYGGKLGLFDPPVPVAPCTLGDCGDAGAATPTTAAPVTTQLADDPTTPSSKASPSPTMPNGPSSTLVTSQATATTSNTPLSVPNQPPANPISDQSTQRTPNTAEAQPITSDGPPPPIIVDTPPTSAAISVVGGGSSVVIGSQTIAIGTIPVTFSGGGVVSLAPAGGGIIVSNSGVVSTYAISSPAVSLGVVAGQTISGAAVGLSQLVVGSQTLSVGGVEVTLAGNQVASLASGGLVVQAPSGVVTTYSIPSNKAAVIGVIAGQSLSGFAVGSSEAVVGTQTMTIGGSVVTLAGNQVASLGFSGLVVQAPGGFVTTIAFQPESTTYTILPTVTPVVGPETTKAVQISSSGITSVISPSIVSSTSSASSTTGGLGALIFQTFQGSGVRFRGFGAMAWLPGLLFGGFILC